ncbi:MAG TPA: DUF58 domain-containing protein [Phototrophicaceae bacterium]|nr:DUF58 domain-containing protein [Phototrophicaceae bacterium]
MEANNSDNPTQKQTTISPETLRKIRRIEIRTRRLVRDNLVGAYHSMFKGRGIAFDAVRPYEPGDDVRDIDWNVTARNAGTPFIKRYTEERELTVLLILDASASNFFGTTGQQKQELAAELGAVLALAAIRNNDKVGLLVVSDRVEHFTPPRKGRNHILRLIRDLLAVQPAGKGTDLALALKTANNYLKQKAIIFLISDFLASKDDYETELLVTSRKHDMIAVVLSDPRETYWENVGLVALRDAETDAVEWIDTASKNWRESFVARAERFQQMRDAALSRAQVEQINVPLDGDYVTALVEFFQRRRR